jgi:hypothetical protein
LVSLVTVISCSLAYHVNCIIRVYYVETLGLWKLVQAIYSNEAATRDVNRLKVNAMSNH